MADPKIRYDILANAEGEQDVKRLATALESLDHSIDPELGARARQLGTTIQELGQKDAALQGFQRALVNANEAGRNLEQSTAALSKLKQQLEGIEEPTRKQAGQLQKLTDQEHAAQAAYVRSTAALSDSRQAMEKLGLSTSELAATEQQLRTSLEATKTEIAQFGTGLRTSEERAKQLAVNLQALQNGFHTASDGADVMGQHLETAFKTLGVRSVAQVTAEIDRLKAALFTIKSADPFGPNIDRAAATTKLRIQELERELEGVPPAASKAQTGLHSVATAGATAGASLEAATTRAVAMGAALLGIGSAGQVAQSVLGTAAAFETLRTRLEQTLGSQKAATDAFEGIKKLAIDTPFEVKDLTDTFIRLTNFGLKPTTSQMLALADTAAVAGGGTEALGRVTLALGQAWAKTKLQGDEILQLTEAGVPVWDLLTKATGKNVVELQKLSEVGALGRDVIIKLFDAIGEKNAGASAKLMATYSGAVSNAKDAMAEFFDLIGRSGALDYLTKQLQAALDKFQEMKDSGELERRAQAIAKAFIEFAQGVETAFNALSHLTKVLELLAAAWAAEKVLGYSKALLGIQAAAQVAAVATGELAVAQRAAAAETAAASVAVAGVGARAATSAVAVGLLGRAMSLLRGLGIGALVLGVSELAIEFFRAKKAAEDGEEAVRKMLAGPPAGQQGAAKAIRDVNAELADFRKNLPKLEGDIAALTGEGLANVAKSTIENLRAIRAPAEDMQKALLVLGERAAKTLGIELPTQAAKASDSFKGVQAEALTLINQLPALGLNAKTASDVVARALAKMIDGANTKREFELVNAEIKLMADAGRVGPGAVAELMKLAKDRTQELKDKVDETTPGIQGLREAATKAGIDANLLTTGITKGGRDAAQAMTDLVAQIVSSGVAADKASPVLGDALNKRVQAAQTKEEVDLLRQQIDKAALAGKLFGADLTTALEGAKKKAEELSPAFRQAAADAKLLGVELQGAVKVSPEAGIQAFERLKASGKATADEVTAAFVNLSNAQIKAANGVVPEWVKVEAQFRGAIITIDEAGNAVVQTLAAADKAATTLASSLSATGAAAKAAGTEVDGLKKSLLDVDSIASHNASVKSGAAAGSGGAALQNTARGSIVETRSGQVTPPDNSGKWSLTAAGVAYANRSPNGQVPASSEYWVRSDQGALDAQEAARNWTKPSAAQADGGLAPGGFQERTRGEVIEIKFRQIDGSTASAFAWSQAQADKIVAGLQEAFKQAGGG